MKVYLRISLKYLQIRSKQLINTREGGVEARSSLYENKTQRTSKPTQTHRYTSNIKT